MTKLGFEDRAAPTGFKEAIDRPYGMVLVTGPTGSGKTTTLYSALAALNIADANISTAEDPVEFNFAGINQVQMHDDIGLNFARAARLPPPGPGHHHGRRDPRLRDRRDRGQGRAHRPPVLSTLHTNDAPGRSTAPQHGHRAVPGDGSLNLILAQRLARRLCPAARSPSRPSQEQALLDVGVPPDEIGDLHPLDEGRVPAESATTTGYKGRVALYEVMPFWDGLKDW